MKTLNEKLDLFLDVAKKTAGKAIAKRQKTIIEDGSKMDLILKRHVDFYQECIKASDEIKEHVKNNPKSDISHLLNDVSILWY